MIEHTFTIGVGGKKNHEDFSWDGLPMFHVEWGGAIDANERTLCGIGRLLEDTVETFSSEYSRGISEHRTQVEKGQVRLPPEANPPEYAKVYVVFPGPANQGVVRTFSPRLLHPEQAADFVKEVIPENRDAGL